MTRNRRLKITIEKDEVIVIRNAARLTSAWCGACGQETPHVTPDVLTNAFGISTASIHQRLESGQAHVIEENSGILICLGSLLE